MAAAARPAPRGAGLTAGFSAGFGAGAGFATASTALRSGRLGGPAAAPSCDAVVIRAPAPSAAQACHSARPGFTPCRSATQIPRGPVWNRTDDDFLSDARAFRAVPVAARASCPDGARDGREVRPLRGRILLGDRRASGRHRDAGARVQRGAAQPAHRDELHVLLRDGHHPLQPLQERRRGGVGRGALEQGSSDLSGGDAAGRRSGEFHSRAR